MHRPTKVSDLNLVLVTDQKVLRLDVPVNDSIIVHVFQADNHAAGEEFALVLRESLPIIQTVPEVATGHQICHKVQFFMILERIKHIDKKPVVRGSIRFEGELTDA